MLFIKFYFSNSRFSIIILIHFFNRLILIYLWAKIYKIDLPNNYNNFFYISNINYNKNNELLIIFRYYKLFKYFKNNYINIRNIILLKLSNNIF